MSAQIIDVPIDHSLTISADASQQVTLISLTGSGTTYYKDRHGKGRDSNPNSASNDGNIAAGGKRTLSAVSELQASGTAAKFLLISTP